MSHPESLRHRDDDHLRALGYEPKFERKINLIANFALGFLYLSPMVGVVALFALGMTKAGPLSVFWILIVGAGMLLVALVFGEIVSQFPLAGGLYQWTRRLWNGRTAWWMSWVYIGGTTVGITTTALFSSGFVASLLFGTPDEPSVTANPIQTLLITLGVIGIGLFFNLRGSKSLARISQIGLAGELIGIIGVGLYLIIFQRKNDISVFFSGMGADGGGSFLALFLGASLVGLYMFYGFEACGEVAEETPNPGRSIPRAMVMTVIIGGAAAVFSFVGYVLAAPNLAEIVSGEDANPVPSILQSSLGTVGMKIFLVVILISFLAGVMGQQTASSRLVFSFARDGMFPGSHAIAKTGKNSHVPVNALLVINILPVLITTYVFFSPDSLFRIAAFQMVAGYCAFAVVVTAALRARLKGWRPAGPFSLGRWGLTINIAALCYLVFGMVVLTKPDLSLEAPWYDQWIALIGFLVVALSGLAYLLVAKPDRASTAPQGDAIHVAEKIRQFS
ncbi:APC family permease [Pseudarthrobacter raffinosi]|uniref:APC family permease n=1 Tax=Pseudarthrobacter raffinosi TaxID=2953651 RepID=UPI00208F1645|nr:amino acid permease [Pseudarthrobacter sp. MDT3-9]MCO4253255.1 amino acid permease [Pseudarthrobacter sp. MDT3-9]